jgi:heat shock protein HslJ
MGLLKIPAVLFAAAAILVAGCIASGPAPASPGEGGTDPTGTSWVLLSMLDAGGNLTPVPADPPVTLEFRNTGTLGGSAGCNRYGGSYERHGIRINITGVTSTLMYCADTGVNNREAAYLGLLGRARFVRIDGDSLRFFDGEGGDLLAFTRAGPSSAQLMAGRWVLNSMASGTGGVTPVLAGTQIDAMFGSDGSLSGSAGCNLYFARYTASGASLTIGSVAATKKSCTIPAGIMGQEQSFLSLLALAAGYSIEGNELVLVDNGGNNLLWFQPGGGP